MPPAALERRRSSRLARKESAAPYGKSGSGSTGLTSYMGNTSIDFDEDKKAEEPARSFSLFGGKGKKKVVLPPNWKKAKDKEGKLYYFNQITQQRSHEPPPALPTGWKEALHKDTGRIYYYNKKQGKTVFISCSTLIKEVKLCVGAELQDKLDALYSKLTKHEIPAEQAVKQLMEMVGSTVVQQAGLSVMNAQKGVLPHGWLEYADEASGRPYYYNVHTKVTTWYKPSGNVPPPPPAEADEADHGINLSCTLDTHNVAMTGFI